MTLVTWLAYASDVWVLSTYAWLARGGRAKPFHLANAIGCIPVIAVEISTHAWPVLPLTAVFGAAGAYGYLKELRK